MIMTKTKINIFSYLNAQNYRHIYIVLLIATIAALPHFFTHNDIWDGVIFSYAFETGDYSYVKDVFRKVNVIHFAYYYIIIDKVRMLLDIDVHTAIDIATSLLLLFSTFSFYIFLHNALRIDKSIATVFSCLYCFLPIFTLLSSNVVIVVILAPSLIFFGMGIFYSNRKILKLLGLVVLFIASISPLFSLFYFGCILLAYLQDRNKRFSLKKMPEEATLILVLYAGLLFYYINSQGDLTGGYNFYGRKDNAIYGLRMFYEYSHFIFPALVLPGLLMIYKLVTDTKYALLLILAFCFLIVFSIAPYALFNKQPICVIDVNCKENIFDWKERHSMVLLFCMIIMSAIATNFIISFKVRSKYLLLSIITVIFTYTLLPVYILNHKRNIIREHWMSEIREPLSKIPTKYNFVEVLMPNTGILYRLRSYDLLYLAYQAGINNVIFRATMVDARNATTHNDYFIAPAKQNFLDVVATVKKNVKDPTYIDGYRMIKQWDGPVCGARYIMTSVAEDISNYFDMRKNNVSKWNLFYFPVHEIDVELQLIAVGCGDNQRKI